MKTICYILIFLVLTSCATVGFLPSDEFIKSNNYQEVIGEGNASEDRSPDTYTMYPHGLKGINAYIAENTNFPKKAIEKNIEGIVIVSYVVESDGSVGRIELTQLVHPSLNREAVRVIKTMERWVPAVKNGKPVPIRYFQPINFKFKS